jgi:hypothetical protein
MIEIPVIDLGKNPKQFDYFVEVVKACNGITNMRKFGFGGAIRGGKTFITLGILIYLCNRYKGSKWHTMRHDFPALQDTTIPSLEKIIRQSSNWKWNRDRSNYFAYNKYDSKIFFKGENIKQDPNLDDLLGLETNGFFMEQLEGQQQKTWELASSRAGSWYIDPMPPAFMFTTLNPTQKWPKKEIYLKYKNGELPADFFFQEAFPTDNAFVTQDQWNAWGGMDERYQKQFVGGDWTNFDETDNLFCYSYSEAKHIGAVELNPKGEVYLSFDFNVDPITCLVAQIYNNTLYGIEQISLTNSDIYKLCAYIKAKYGGRMFLVTGDASGQNRSALTKDNMNYYQIIKNELGLGWGQFKVPASNPSLEENRVLVNAVLHKHKVVLDKENCKKLIHDLENVRVLPDGGIDKSDKSLTHAMDCLRYICNTFLSWVLKT